MAVWRAHNGAMPATSLSSQHTVQSFGDLSRFLREGVADEESRELRDSLSGLSQLIDEAVKARRRGKDPQAILGYASALSRASHEHLLVLTGLGSAWHALYEFGAYHNAMRELRVAIEAWQAALQRRSSREAACFDHFEKLAWRTLGEALLLIDMYEHSSQPQSDLAPAGAALKPARSPLSRVRAWLRTWI